MRVGKKWLVVSLTIALLLGAFAFAQQTGLVNVNISNVRTEIAKNINVDVSQIPVTVQAPIDVAANVCGIAVDVLTSQVQQGNASCTAKNTSTALNDIVQNQLKKK